MRVISKVVFPVIVVLIILFTFSTISLANPDCSLTQTHDPVLLVHGWGLNTQITWPLMISRLTSANYDVYSIDFSDNTGSNVVNAQELKNKVDEILSQTGASKVDILTHSMGGISTRYYIKHLGGDSKVNDVVELGCPNHGTLTFSFNSTPGGKEIKYMSPFIRDLNCGDETPGSMKWTSIFSLSDLIIRPVCSSRLAGARNRIVFRPVGHLRLAYDWIVYTWVADALNGSGSNDNNINVSVQEHFSNKFKRARSRL